MDKFYLRIRFALGTHVTKGRAFSKTKTKTFSEEFHAIQNTNNNGLKMNFLIWKREGTTFIIRTKNHNEFDRERYGR